MPKATIASGASLSAAVDTGLVTPGAEIIGLQMPSSWTTANLTFQGSHDGTTYNNVHDDGGTEFTVTADASRLIGFRDNGNHTISKFRYLKIRSGTNGSPVAQGAEREIQILTK